MAAQKFFFFAIMSVSIETNWHGKSSIVSLKHYRINYDLLIGIKEKVDSNFIIGFCFRHNMVSLPSPLE